MNFKIRRKEGTIIDFEIIKKKIGNI